MQINPIRIQATYPKYDVKRVQSTVEVKPMERDSVQLSGFAQIFSEAVKSLKESISIPSKEHEQRVEQVAQQIEAGTYDVDSTAIAKKILQGTHFDEEL